MNERVARLRRETLETKPWISVERASLLTDFYRADKTASVPIRRALAFQYLLEHKEIYIGPDDLIVGERGPAPKGTPTFPELCCHTMQDLDILDSREKISFGRLRHLRSLVERRFPEVEEFDRHIERIGRHHANAP